MPVLDRWSPRPAPEFNGPYNGRTRDEQHRPNATDAPMKTTDTRNENTLPSPAAAAKNARETDRRTADPVARPALHTRPLLLAAILALIAFSLRTPITSVGPVLVEAVRATRLAPSGASVLTTLPSFCFGLFGPLAPLVARRLGSERALLVLLVLLTAGTALRVVPAWQALFVGQIVACFSIGLMNVLMPGLVKRDFPHHVALVTGLYSAAMCAGAAAAAALTVPVADAIARLADNLHADAWAWALAAWALPAGLATLVWFAHHPSAQAAASGPAPVVHGLLRDRLAWQVTLFMGTQSSLAYIVFGWLAAILRMRGMSAVEAGLVLSLSVIAQAASSLILPVVIARLRDQRFVNVAALLIACASLLGTFFAPLSTVWACALVLGIAQGASFTLALIVIGLRSENAHVAAKLSSMAQGIGYLLASTGPFVAGSLLHATGTLYSLAALCVALCTLSAAFGYFAGRRGHVNVRCD